MPDIILPDNQGLVAVTKRGNVINTEWMKAVDHLLDMHAKTPQWDFIEYLIKVWAKREPDQYQSYTSQTQNAKYRGEALNKFAANKDKGMRRILDVPKNLWTLIEFFYPDEIKDSKWLLEFARRFPMFKVPDVL